MRTTRIRYCMFVTTKGVTIAKNDTIGRMNNMINLVVYIYNIVKNMEFVNRGNNI